ncbi:hypothetical protein ACGF5C_16615 [Micromonospora sp. NPDC047620]|uniref:hypothetical protein n=1 Tax=Micromonospora sp. NPDC047620 TaxID=3364251 RepID=UPI00371DB9B7
MDWTTLIATLGGAAIAFTGTLLADFLRHRNERDRGQEARSRDLYIQFIVAAGICHTRLREIAQSADQHANREIDSRSALAEARIYEIRERLFIDAAPAVAAAGQIMFERLRAMRKVVANGASLTSPELHESYHPYLEAVWNYRAAVREELKNKSLSLSDFGWPVWNGSTTCSVCLSIAQSKAPARTSP